MIAERTADLRKRAEGIHAEYELVTHAYAAGEVTKSEYAQRLASLNARATHLLASYEHLRQHAENISSLELRAAGTTLSSLDAAIANLSHVTGPGSSALLEQYLGDTGGTIELETRDGRLLEIRRENGELAREFEHPPDDDRTITVRHAHALQTASDALSTPVEGHWHLAALTIKASTKLSL